MGRARQQTKVSESTWRDPFALALGTRRGSEVAQAQRDSAEAAAHAAAQELALKRFPEQVAQNPGSDAAVILAGVLVDVYRNGAAANMYKQLLASLTSIEEVFARATAAFDGALAHLTILGDFADILEVGDPEACPGLVEPLYRALCDHFSSFYIDPVVLYPQAEEVIERLFVSAARKAESYQRLGHLCDSLGALLAHPAQEGKTHLVVAAVEALFSAPEEALAGPLCSWMDAIIARIDCGLITADERDKILMMSREQEQQVDDALAQRVASGALTQSEAALLLNRDHGPQSLAALVARVRA